MNRNSGQPKPKQEPSTALTILIEILDEGYKHYAKNSKQAQCLHGSSVLIHT